MAIIEIPRTIVDDNIRWVGNVNLLGQRIGEWKQYVDNDLWRTHKYYDQDNILCREYYRKTYFHREGKKIRNYRNSWIWKGEMKLFYPNGSLHSIFYVDIAPVSGYGDQNYMEGPLKTFYPSGTIMRTCNLSKNRIVGPYLVYNSDGSLSYKEEFPNTIPQIVDFVNPDFPNDDYIFEISKDIKC